MLNKRLLLYSVSFVSATCEKVVVSAVVNSGVPVGVSSYEASIFWSFQPASASVELFLTIISPSVPPAGSPVPVVGPDPPLTVDQ